MSEQAVEALLERVEHDPNLRHQLEDAHTTEEKTDIIHSAGFDVGQSDLLELKKAAGYGGEMSDDEPQFGSSSSSSSFFSHMAQEHQEGMSALFH